MLQRKADVVEAFEQAVTGELVHRELCAETLIITYGAVLKVDRELITGNVGSFSRDLSGLVFGQCNGKHAIFRAIIRKDVGER